MNLSWMERPSTCASCAKRPYVCLTSLSGTLTLTLGNEKYPCHYCSKVFCPGRVQNETMKSLTRAKDGTSVYCAAKTFLNYQILSTHCKQMHNQDPSGRKEKDDSCNNLYRLLPCKNVAASNRIPSCLKSWEGFQ